eukprot:TRINITY_DN5774_c0_g1_i1.p1 TRINITY_DN5774_c0_g1~~TRINITY_DN5774_c0_g1_i1.p1  ORF type:complete len:66 (+),score=20.05 TRINITY_DN5774_c0_g1_i1:451-648(+)
MIYIFIDICFYYTNIYLTFLKKKIQHFKEKIQPLGKKLQFFKKNQKRKKYRLRGRSSETAKAHRG